MKWNELTSLHDVEALIEQSHRTPCLIFKHSTRCPVSSIARHRLESDWKFGEQQLAPYFLDLIRYREVSAAIADQFGVQHESPQVLLIRGGYCTYDSSHLNIMVEEIEECYADEA